MRSDRWSEIVGIALILRCRGGVAAAPVGGRKSGVVQAGEVDILH